MSEFYTKEFKFNNLRDIQEILIHDPDLRNVLLLSGYELNITLPTFHMYLKYLIILKIAGRGFFVHIYSVGEK